MTLIKGIDVSRHNGDIDFKKVKKLGIDFVIIKAGGADDDLYEDVKFKTNYFNALEAGLSIGCYFICGRQSKTRERGVEEAKFLMNIINNLMFSYPIYYDVEFLNENHPTKDEVTNCAIGFLETMESSGYYVGTYSSLRNGYDVLLDTSRLNKFDKWLACWNDSGVRPDTPYKYNVWQYNATGVVDGIKGFVDLNYSYYDFNQLGLYPKIKNIDVSKNVEYQQLLNEIAKTLQTLNKKLEELV